MFFRDFDMTLRRVSDVVAMDWVRESERSNHTVRYRVEMADGQYRYVDDVNFGIIMNASSQLLPAIAGTILLELKDTEHEERTNDPFHRTPVIGWRIDQEGGIRPITSAGFWEDEKWNVLMPNGSVVDAFGSTFASEADCLKYINGEVPHA
mgnify:FL=1